MQEMLLDRIDEIVGFVSQIPLLGNIFESKIEKKNLTPSDHASGFGVRK